MKNAVSYMWDVTVMVLCVLRSKIIFGLKFL